MAESTDRDKDMEPVAPVEDWTIDPSALQMGDLIGEGSFGKVYKAKYLGIDVAVKQIVEGVEQAQEFEHEVAVLKYVRSKVSLKGRLQTVGVLPSVAHSYRLLDPCPTPAAL